MFEPTDRRSCLSILSGVTPLAQRPADWMPGAAACIRMIQQPVSQRAVSGI